MQYHWFKQKWPLSKLFNNLHYYSLTNNKNSPEGNRPHLESNSSSNLGLGFISQVVFRVKIQGWYLRLLIDDTWLKNISWSKMSFCFLIFFSK